MVGFAAFPQDTASSKRLLVTASQNIPKMLRLCGI